MKNDFNAYEEIDQLVFEYQKGNAEAGLELLRRFGYHEQAQEMDLFLGKYFKLLRYGTINFADKDTRKFIRQFTKNEALKKALLPFYQYADAKREARKIVQMVNDRLSRITDEELQQDLCVVLLEKAMRYEKVKPKVNFCGYLFNSFRYRLFETQAPLFKDMLYGYEMELFEDKADEFSEIDIDELTKPDLYFKGEQEELGFNWILGKTAGFPFDQLTVFDRTLLHMHEVKGMTLEQVGLQMGYHRDTIWLKRKRIKEHVIGLWKNPPPD